MSTPLSFSSSSSSSKSSTKKENSSGFFSNKKKVSKKRELPSSFSDEELPKKGKLPQKENLSKGKKSSKTGPSSSDEEEVSTKITSKIESISDIEISDMESSELEQSNNERSINEETSESEKESKKESLEVKDPTLFDPNGYLRKKKTSLARKQKKKEKKPKKDELEKPEKVKKISKVTPEEQIAWLKLVTKSKPLVPNMVNKVKEQIWEKELVTGYFPEGDRLGVFLEDSIVKKLEQLDPKNDPSGIWDLQWWLLQTCLSFRVLSYQHFALKELVNQYPLLDKFTCWVTDYDLSNTAKKRVGTIGEGPVFKKKEKGKTLEFPLHRLSTMVYNSFDYFSGIASANSEDEKRDDLGDASHLCHNSKCWRPTHIILESHKTNMWRNSCPGWQLIIPTKKLHNLCRCPNRKCMRINVFQEKYPILDLVENQN